MCLYSLEDNPIEEYVNGTITFSLITLINIDEETMF